MDTQKYKQQLEDEKAQLTEQLGEVATLSGGEWIPKASQLVVDQADQNEVADAMEEGEEHIALTHELRARFANVERALAKIEAGTFGVDEFDGEPIEEDRLNANPAARTRKANMERENELEN